MTIYTKYKEAFDRANKKYRESNPELIRELGKIRARRYYNKNKEKALFATKLWRLKNPDHKLRARLKHLYGLTIEEFEQLKNKQKKCSGCNKLFNKNLKSYVDHCHKTGKVRGLLCIRCNLMLGYAKDNPKILRSLANYLIKKKV